MSLFEGEGLTPPRRGLAAPLPLGAVDLALTAQLVVAWAGETGEQRRLGWWRTDLVSEFGGQDLFSRLLPHTWEWAVLQAAREAARRTDAELRRRDHDPDSVLTLFHLGFERDERLEERFQAHKRSGQRLADALPTLARGIDSERFDAQRFAAWARGLAGSGEASDVMTTPLGRAIRGGVPESFEELLGRLVGALVPLAEAYPLPHYRMQGA